LLLLGSAVRPLYAQTDGQPTPVLGAPGAGQPSAAAAEAVARADAARRFGLTQDQITTISIQSVVWPTLNLGCPLAPGMVAGQIVVPGFIVELDAAGTQLSYHTDGGAQAMLCVPAASSDDDSASD
jgi:hypothetical protein